MKCSEGWTGASFELAPGGTVALQNVAEAFQLGDKFQGLSIESEERIVGVIGGAGGTQAL
jgi:hypothetical protein